ncbi:MAG: hypothetical protein ACRDAX_02310 [Propionibacteriaceae bacterium]
MEKINLETKESTILIKHTSDSYTTLGDIILGAQYSEDSQAKDKPYALNMTTGALEEVPDRVKSAWPFNSIKSNSDGIIVTSQGGDNGTDTAKISWPDEKHETISLQNPKVKQWDSYPSMNNDFIIFNQQTFSILFDLKTLSWTEITTPVTLGETWTWLSIGAAEREAVRKSSEMPHLSECR